jgi:pimeloyl-ACP methyl ester carboxylesterase
LDRRRIAVFGTEATVNPTIETREVISVRVGENCLWGTYHKSLDAQASQRYGEQDRVGVLFLNPGFLPRASPSAVYWADTFASYGYPAFRFDLPGLGDSEGSTPENMLEYVSAGGYAPALSAIVKDVTERFGLAGVVLMGLCAGAVTALYTAAAARECCGVVMMDPYFNVPPKRTKFRNDLSLWSTWSGIGAFVSETYHRLRYLGLLLSGNRLPSNANLPLLTCWRQLASAGTPILVLKAPSLRSQGVKPRTGVFDYLGYLRSKSESTASIAVRFVEGTDHSFADPAGCAAVRQHTVQWLNDCFPASGAKQPMALTEKSLRQTAVGA